MRLCIDRNGWGACASVLEVPISTEGGRCGAAPGAWEVGAPGAGAVGGGGVGGARVRVGGGGLGVRGVGGGWGVGADFG